MTAVMERPTIAGLDIVTSYEVLGTSRVCLFLRADVARIGLLNLQPLCEKESNEQRSYPRDLLSPLCSHAVYDCAPCWAALRVFQEEGNLP